MLYRHVFESIVVMSFNISFLNIGRKEFALYLKKINGITFVFLYFEHTLLVLQIDVRFRASALCPGLLREYLPPGSLGFGRFLSLSSILF